MVKLSLKRLQPNWPCDEIIGNRLSSIRRSEETSIYRAPTKTILKTVWLKGLPIGRRSIQTINANNLNDSCTHLSTLNLEQYLRSNNPRFEINNDTITSVIHIAFNMMGLLYQRWHDSGGILFDYVKTNNIRTNNTIENLFEDNNLTLNLSWYNVNLLRDLILGHQYQDFWLEIKRQYEDLRQNPLYQTYARIYGNRHLRFPARRSGFCRREDESVESGEIYTTRYVINDNNNQWSIDSQEFTTIRPPEINDLLIGFSRQRRTTQELNPRIQECIQILNDHPISEETKFHIYELILACTNDTL